MTEPARTFPLFDDGSRHQPATGPLRDWLAAMRATAPEAAPAREEAIAPHRAERPATWAPRLVEASDAPQPDEDVAEILAENLMLKAKLRLEADRRDELQILLAQEIRELRSYVDQEIAQLDDLREERDLWKARCEALAGPLFQGRIDR